MQCIEQTADGDCPVQIGHVHGNVTIVTAPPGGRQGDPRVGLMATQMIAIILLTASIATPVYTLKGIFLAAAATLGLLTIRQGCTLAKQAKQLGGPPADQSAKG